MPTWQPDETPSLFALRGVRRRIGSLRDCIETASPPTPAKGVVHGLVSGCARGRFTVAVATPFSRPC
jgi:hypothetical protein